MSTHFGYKLRQNKNNNGDKGDNGKKTDEFYDFTESPITELKEPFEFKIIMQHNKTRSTIVYLLVGAFVLSVLGCEVYSMVTNNNELLDKSIVMLGNAAMLGIGYYIGENK